MSMRLRIIIKNMSTFTITRHCGFIQLKAMRKNTKNNRHNRMPSRYKKCTICTHREYKNATSARNKVHVVNYIMNYQPLQCVLCIQLWEGFLLLHSMQTYACQLDHLRNASSKLNTSIYQMQSHTQKKLDIKYMLKTWLLYLVTNKVYTVYVFLNDKIYKSSFLQSTSNNENSRQIPTLPLLQPALFTSKKHKF